MEADAEVQEMICERRVAQCDQKAKAYWEAEQTRIQVWGEDVHNSDEGIINDML